MSDRLTVSTKLETDGESAAMQAGRAFIHSLIVSPLQSGEQIVAKVADGIVGVKLEIPERSSLPVAEFGSSAWHAQQIGQGAGMLPWMLLLHKGSNAFTRGVMARFERGAAAGMENNLINSAGGVAVPRSARGLFSEMCSSGLTGATFGAFLIPNDPGTDFFEGRKINAASSALTFLTLTGSTRGLERLGIKSVVTAGTVAAIPAGIIAAESRSLLSHSRFAGEKELVQSVYGLSFAGAAFGYAGGRMGTGISDTATLVEKANHPVSTKVRIADVPAQPATIDTANLVAKADQPVSTKVRIADVPPTQPATIDTANLVAKADQPVSAKVRIADVPAQPATIDTANLVAKADQPISIEVRLSGELLTRPAVKIPPKLAPHYEQRIKEMRDRVKGGEDAWKGAIPAFSEKLSPMKLSKELQSAPTGELNTEVLLDLKFDAKPSTSVESEIWTSISRSTGTVVVEKPGSPWIVSNHHGQNYKLH